MPQEIDCPQCHAINTVPDIAIGSYFACKTCHCLFWVTVPPLGEASRPALRERLHEARAATSEEPIHNADPTLKTLMRQEALLFTISREMKSLRKVLWCFGIVILLLVLACAAVCVSLLR